jgi:hypothetical protein
MNKLEESRLLEQKAMKLKSEYYEELERKSWIKLGTIIFDEDANVLAVVSGLSKGCIDFSADYLDGSYSRGYHFGVHNWRLPTETELMSR